MRITYLTNRYPAVSHTFVRRELLALERLGHAIDRMSIRPVEQPLPDPQDRDEAVRTTALLGGSRVPLMLRALGQASRSPGVAIRAFAFAARLSRRSRVPLAKMAAYYAEALIVAAHCRANGSNLLRVHFATNGAIVARLARRLGGPPYCLAFHGPDEFDAPKRWDIAGLVADAAFVTAITHFCAGQIMRWSAPADWPKIEIVRCGVDPAFLEPLPLPADQPRRLCCVARLAPQKGLPLLLDAVARTSSSRASITLDIVGDGPARDDLEAQARRLGIAGRVRFHGPLSGAGVREVIAASHVMAMASFAEGLPVVLMEAMGLGRPVIATAIAGIPELVRDGENGWIATSGDVDGLAAAIGAFAAAPLADLARLGDAAHRACAAAHEIGAQAALLDAAIARHVH